MRSTVRGTGGIFDLETFVKLRTGDVHLHTIIQFENRGVQRNKLEFSTQEGIENGHTTTPADSSMPRSDQIHFVIAGVDSIAAARVRACEITKDVAGSFDAWTAQRI